MDKRLINFILVSMLLFIVYMELLKLMRGDQPAPQQQDEVTAVDENDEAETQDIVAEASPDEDAVPEEATALPQERPVIPLQRFTIGSVDPADGYTMLVTFINRGAAVERVELSDPRYRDLEDSTAYIGHLALSDTADGALVGVVGGGTPAKKAGMQVDDVITKIGDIAVTSAESARDALRQYKHTDEVAIEVVRDGKTIPLTVLSIRRPLEVIRPEPELPTAGLETHQLSYLLTLHHIGGRSTQFDQTEFPELPSLRRGNWESSLSDQDGAAQVEFRFPLASHELAKIGAEGAIEVVKRFSLRPRTSESETTGRNYHFDFDVEIVNQGAQDLAVGYRIDGATGLPLEGWWYSYKTRPGYGRSSWGAAGVRDVVWRQIDGRHSMYANPQIRDRARDHLEDNESKEYPITAAGGTFRLDYLGVDAQYFNSSLLATKDAAAEPRILERVDARTVGAVDAELNDEGARNSWGPRNRTDVTFRADSSSLTVPAGSSTTHSYEIFAGPKHKDVLADYGLEECIVYGWFKWPAQLMGVLLHAFHAVTRNYGIAIILLTIVVRACMLPVGRKMAMNAKKMQELSPEIKKIKEMYPNETDKQAKAQQELFRKHNYNPLAGCLPMFIQIPIFIGLYKGLSVDIDLRQTPLIPGLDWCSNLAGPDMLFRWDWLIPFEAITGYTGWLGPFLNILPIVSGCVFIFHQKLFTPPPTDEQQEMTQKIMMIMPIMMCVIFFRMPAGLNLYFITSSLWALGERLMLPKDLKPGEKPKQSSLAASLSRVTSSSNGSSGTATAIAAKKKRRKRNKK